MADETPRLQMSLTPYGNKLLLTQGVNKTFVKYTVNDSGQLYDVTATPDLTTTLPGGLRTLVSLQPTCGFASTKKIGKNKPTTEELQQSTTRLEWTIEKVDCSNPYTANNPKIFVHLKRWFNYLESNEGDANYDYNNRLSVNLFDNVSAKISQLNASTLTYDQISSNNSLDISYVFDNSKSLNNYLDFNAYTMTVDQGVKKLVNNTKTRFTSPFILAFHSDNVKDGNSDVLKLTMNPKYGYVVKAKDSKERTFYRSDFVSLETIESKTVDELNKMYKTIKPAVVISDTNANRDLFVFDDGPQKYTESIDTSASYTYQFKNSDNESLMSGLIRKGVNLIQYKFPEISSGVYEQVINFKVDNTVVNKQTFNEQQIYGGFVEVILNYDSTDTTVPTNIDSIVEWL